MTRQRAACLVAWIACGAAAAGWQGQGATGTQQPVFRAGVDVTQLDVSVLDKNRHPIHGLGLADFSVTENGKTQTLVGVTEVTLPGRDDLPAAWLRFVPSDVATNFLGDRLGDSRLVVVVMDDSNVPFDDDQAIASARQIARDTVDRLGPLDVASVVYTRDTGLSQDFTSDHDLLVRAISAFQPRPPLGEEPLPPPNGYPAQGDMQRHDTLNRLSRCESARPAVPTLLSVAREVAAVTERRKTIVFISTGERDTSASASDCIAIDERDLFSIAQRANVNIYAIDPRGSLTIAQTSQRGGRSNRPALPGRIGGQNFDFLTILSDNTGGTPIVNVDDFDTGLDRLFEENGSYYLLGYQSTNLEPDGKFRRVEVHVNRSGATVRARRGYYGPTAKPGAGSADQAPPSELNRIGLAIAPGLTLRLALAPFALPGADLTPGRAAVAMTLGMREPAPLAPVDEDVTVIVSATKDGGSPVSALAPHTVSFTLKPTGGEVTPHEWSSRLDFPPGRYELRFNAHSKVYDRGASVYGEVDVPDFAKPGVWLSGVVFGGPADGPDAADNPLTALLPLTPTTERVFARGQRVVAFVRIYQGGEDPLESVALKAQVLDGKDTSQFDVSSTLAIDQFGTARTASYQLDLSKIDLQPGPHLLDIQATRSTGNAARRDVPFFVR